MLDSFTRRYNTVDREKVLDQLCGLMGFFFLAGKLRNLFPVLLLVVQAKD